MIEDFYQHNFRELPYAMKKHWATRLHDDLRLQCNGVLLSWALIGTPIFRVGESRTAIEMEDHDKANLLFEGVHKTGPIMVWDCGSWEPLTGLEDGLPSLKSGSLRFALRGGKLQGIWTLTRKTAATDVRRAVWVLRKEADLFEHPPFHRFLKEDQPVSIMTSRTLEEIVRDWYTRRYKQPKLFN